MRLMDVELQQRNMDLEVDAFCLLLNDIRASFFFLYECVLNMTYIVTPDGNGFPISFGSVGRFLLMPPINVGLKTLPISSCPNSKI